MEKHIATYTIESENLQQTISLLYETYLRSGQYPAIVIAGLNTYKWDTPLAHKLATNTINEHDYARACKI